MLIPDRSIFFSRIFSFYIYALACKGYFLSAKKRENRNKNKCHSIQIKRPYPTKRMVSAYLLLFRKIDHVLHWPFCVIGNLFQNQSQIRTILTQAREDISAIKADYQRDESFESIEAMGQCAQLTRDLSALPAQAKKDLRYFFSLGFAYLSFVVLMATKGEWAKDEGIIKPLVILQKIIYLFAYISHIGLANFFEMSGVEREYARGVVDFIFLIKMILIPLIYLFELTHGAIFLGVFALEGLLIFSLFYARYGESKKYLKKLILSTENLLKHLSKQEKSLKMVKKCCLAPSINFSSDIIHYRLLPYLAPKSAIDPLVHHGPMERKNQSIPPKDYPIMPIFPLKAVLKTHGISDLIYIFFCLGSYILFMVAHSH